MLLPQTTFRLLGIQESMVGGKLLVQYPFNQRFGFTPEVSAALRLMSRQVAEILNMKYVEVKDDNFDYFNSEMLVDCHLTNLRRYYKTFKRSNYQSINVLDYSSLGHRSLVLSDLREGLDLFRALKRNYLFSQEVGARLIVHWDDYARFRQEEMMLHPWQHLFLETELVVQRSGHLLQQLTEMMVQLKFLRDIGESVVIFCPHVKQRWSQVRLQLPRLIASIEDNNSSPLHTLIIKPHRASQAIFPTFDRIGNSEIFVMNDSVLRNLPVELFSLGLSSPLAGYPSSSMFSHEFGRKLLLLAGDQNDLREYGLMLGRMKVKRKFAMQRESVENSPSHHYY